MTVFCVLFADVSNGEQPIFISDVLLTSEIRNSKSTERYEKKYLPSVGGTFPQVSAFSSISGLMQKTYALKNGPCFSFAGGYEAAANFFADIKDKSDVCEIIDVVQRYKSLLQFAVAIPDSRSDRIIFCATESCKRLQPGSYGTVMIGGSGDNTFRELLVSHQNRPFRGDPDLDNIGRALVLINEALEMDSDRPAETLGESFGAYYEITVPVGAEFIKLGNVAHHYLTVRIVEEELYWVLERSYFHEYVGTDLLVRRISWGTEGDEHAVWQDCYAIGGFSGPLNMHEAKTRVESTAPKPTIEVLRIRFEHSNFRIVSTARQLISINKKEGRWFFDVDTALAHEISNSMADALFGKDGSE